MMSATWKQAKKNQNDLRHRETVYLGVGGATEGLLHQLLLFFY